MPELRRSGQGRYRKAGGSQGWQTVQVILHDNSYSTRNTVFGSSEASMLMTSGAANDKWKGYKSSCNVGGGNGVVVCGTYASYQVPNACSKCP
uniref:Uncharacterized protein n=1 Tax=Tetradesmus obliquus TaxID=3088 RepID=A0A383VPG9_TETOB